MPVQLNGPAVGQPSVSGDGANDGTVASIGDSIMHCSTFQGRKSASFVEYAAIASGGAMRIAGNFGVSGERSGQVLTRISQPLATGAKTIMVMVGTNDMLQSVPLATYRTNLQRIASAIKAAGRRGILCGLPPHSTLNSAQYSAVVQSVAQELGLTYAQPWGPVVSQGAYVAGYSADGVHPRPLSHRLAGQRLWQQIAPLFAGADDLAWRDADTSGIVVRQSNGLFLASSGGVPTGYTAWASNPAALVSTVEAGSGEVQGNWWVQTYTAVSQICFFTSPNVTLPSDWRAGDRVRLQCRVDVSGLDANGVIGDASFSQSARLQPYIAWNWAGGAKTILRSIGSDIGGIYSLDDVVPANAPATGAWEIGVEYRNTTGSGTASGVVKLAQLNLHNLSRAARI